MDEKPPERQTSTGHPSNNPGLDDLDALFTFHAADEVDRANMASVRMAARAMGETLLRCCPPCADRSAALRKVREALMTANAAIMLEGK